MDRLLTVNPKEVRLNFEVGKKAFAKLHLNNLMHTMPVAFKILTTAPEKYGVRPQIAIIPPLGDAWFEVVMIAQQNLPESFPVSFDKFFVKSMMIPTGKASEKELSCWFTTRKRQVFTDATLRVVFTGSQILRSLVTCESVESVNEVIKYSDVNSRDRQDRTPLYLAALQGNEMMVKALVEAGANVNVKNKMRQTPLLEASCAGHVEIVKILLHAGADTEAGNLRGWTPLHAGASWNRVEVLRLLLDAGANKDARDCEGRTPLHEAAMAGNINAVKVLLHYGVDKEKKCLDGWTALHFAAAYGHLDIVELLLENGANIKVRNCRRKVPYDLALENRHHRLLDALHLQQMLQKAAREGKVEALNDCLLQGASPDGRDQHGWTALHIASFKGHLESVKLLLKHQANVNCKDDEGFTPLHCAAEAGHKEVVRYLLQEGADIKAKSSKGFTSLRLAVAMKQMGVVQLLQEKRSDQKQYEKKSSTFCHYSPDKADLALCSPSPSPSPPKGPVLKFVHPVFCTPCY